MLSLIEKSILQKIKILGAASAAVPLDHSPPLARALSVLRRGSSRSSPQLGYHCDGGAVCFIRREHGADARGLVDGAGCLNGGRPLARGSAGGVVDLALLVDTRVGEELGYLLGDVALLREHLTDAHVAAALQLKCFL